MFRSSRSRRCIPAPTARAVALPAIAVLAAILALSGCAVFTPPSASLRIDLSFRQGGRTLAPDIDLDAAGYDIYGHGPDDAYFEALDVTGSSYLKESLVPGAWTVHAVARNAEGTSIAQSEDAEVTLVVGQTATVALQCVPFAGDGSLSVTLSWPKGSVVEPKIAATLTPRGGAPQTAAFVVDGTTASYASGSNLPGGYYTLAIRLLDGTMTDFEVWSAMEAVQIVAGQTTTGTWTLGTGDVSPAPYPGMLVTLGTDTRQPVEITMGLEPPGFGFEMDPVIIPFSGPVTLQAGTTVSVAVSGNPAPDSWEWYLDGAKLANETGPTLTLGDGLTARSAHTLTAIAVKGDILGSKSVRILITEAKGVTTFAGTWNMAGFADGVRADARFTYPQGMAADSYGNLYLADGYSIRKITPAGIVTTLAGSAEPGKADGKGAAASFLAPMGLAVDASGNVFVTDYGADSIRKVTPGGVVTTLALTCTDTDPEEDPHYFPIPYKATLSQPAGIAVDSSGNLYVVDSSHFRIRKITPTGDMSTYSGSGIQVYADGANYTAGFVSPRALAIDSSGNLYVTDVSDYRIRKIATDGSVSTVAGTGTAGFVDGDVSSARIGPAYGLAVGADGTVYIADSWNNAVRSLSPSDGLVRTIAGKGNEFPGHADDTDPLSASFHFPTGITEGPDGNVYVADSNNQTIRKIVRGSW